MSSFLNSRKLGVALSLVALISSVYGEELAQSSSLNSSEVFIEPIAYKNHQDGQKKQRCKKKQVPMGPIAGLPANHTVESGVNMFFSFDALYWNVRQDGLTYAVQNDATPGHTLTGVNSLSGRDVSIKDSWQWGLRAGAGVNLPYDNWDLFLNWTHLNGHKSDSPGAGPAGLTTLITEYLPAETSSITGRFTLNLNLIDLELGKTFFVSRHFVLRPHIGFRNAWVHEKFNVHLGTTTTTNLATDIIDPGTGIFSSGTLFYKNNFWGLGLRGGLDTEWRFAKGWSLFGNGAFSLIPGFYSLSQDSSGPNTTGATALGTHLTLADVHTSFRTELFVTDAVLGLRWGKYFDLDRYYLQFQLAWENHIFFDQWKWKTVSFIPNANENLSFMGFTLNMSFAF